MNEQQIQEQLKQNIQTIEEPTIAPVAIEQPVGVAQEIPEFELDEISQYNMFQFFGTEYKQFDTESRQIASYIYNRVSEAINTKDFGAILQRLGELERIAGTRHSSNRMGKLYQWLKLESISREAMAKMQNLGDDYGVR